MTGWTTRETAEKCGLSQHTLRWYERIGLLDRVARTADGRRRYSDGDLDWILLLSRLRGTGMPVRDMLRYAELVRSGAGEQERLEPCWKGTASTSARPWQPAGMPGTARPQDRHLRAPGPRSAEQVTGQE